ncbi:nucleotidyltransferase domain-containing protein [Parafannyhessea umbonata]|uniref:nucleotidyltransferase domain-containing protein n=2 Tax=Parafannyhessea umbonata TaxID=604330 RepID=UPI00359C74B9
MLGIITDMRIAVRHMSCSMAKLLESASEILKRHGVRRAVLFGSQAAGKAKSGSDIDLAIWPSGALSASEWFDIQDELDDLPTLRTWDLVDMTRVRSDSPIANEVARHGIELYRETEPAIQTERLTVSGKR